MVGAIATGISGLITSGIQFFSGRKQQKKGEALIAEAEANKVDYETPDQIKNNEAEAEAKSYGKSSIQKLLESDAVEATNRYAGNVKANATSGAQALAMLTQGSKMESDNLRKAALAGEEDQNRKEQIARETKEVSADFGDKEYEYNEREPYINKLSQGNELVGAGMQNKHNAIGGIGQMISAGASMLDPNLKFSDLKKKK